MINQYPLNRDLAIKAIEQKQIKLLEGLRSTSVALIRMAATEEMQDQAIMSISYYEKLWVDVHNFYTKWKLELINISESLKLEHEKLNNKLERIESEVTIEYQNIYTALTGLKRKNE